MYWSVGKGGVDDDRLKKLIDISTAPTFPLDNDELYSMMYGTYMYCTMYCY